MHAQKLMKGFIHSFLGPCQGYGGGPHASSGCVQSFLMSISIHHINQSSTSSNHRIVALSSGCTHFVLGCSSCYRLIRVDRQSSLVVVVRT